tara:strand:+ start:9419 stop:10672 length:1254 start_codon:yes stop_codon:yes gene_type:complete
MINRIKNLRRFSVIVSFAGLYNAFRFFIRIKKIPQVDILYSCHDNSRPILLDGKYYSPLIDSLAMKLNNYSHITLALPFSKYSGNKTSGNTVNLNLYVIAALLKRFLTSGSIALKNIKNDPLIKFYNKLYQKINLKLIIGVLPSIEMCIAAKNNNIKIMDVQHGIIESDDPDSYYSLDKRALYQNSGWPDYILCRNEQSYKTVLKLKDYTKPFLIGNLNKFFYENIYPNKERIPLFKTKGETILFTFQDFNRIPDISSFTKSNMNAGIIFPNALLKLISESNYNFLLKLHPSQIHKKDLFKLHNKAFEKMFDGYDNIDYINCNQMPLEYSLTESDLHITFNSATLYDAMDYGLKTILLDENLERLNNYYGEIMDSNSVVVDSKLEIDFSEHFDEKNQKNQDGLLNNFNFENFILKNI